MPRDREMTGSIPATVIFLTQDSVIMINSEVPKIGLVGDKISPI